MNKTDRKKSKIYFIHFSLTLPAAFIFSLLVLVLGLKMYYIAAAVFAVLAIVAFNSAPVFYHKAKSLKSASAEESQEEETIQDAI